MGEGIRLWRTLGGLVGAALLGGLCHLLLEIPHAQVATASVADSAHLTVSPPEEPKPPLVWTEPALVRQLASSEDEPLRVIVRLRAPAIPLSNQVAPVGHRDSVAARGAIVRARQQDFERSLVPLAALLDHGAQTGHLVARRDLWIAHALALTADASLIRDLMASSAVAEIHLDHFQRYITKTTSLGGATVTELDAVGELPWGVVQVRAPEVWDTFRITGTGAVVGIMDTGVELMHPALLDAYRGSLGNGLYSHAGSWHDAVNQGIYPYDDYGHGTHVAGIILGTATAASPPTGMAPGARWIGVKVLSAQGFGYDSWILEGFQWLLAPDGNPALAPDVVNASWSSLSSASTVFADAVAALEQAGIFAAFAVGNDGPAPGTVGSPASNPGVFAVGASDSDDDVAPFSSRGPSPWDEAKPYVVAPGVDVLSTIPGGVYATMNGTSMATPHVAGLAALMRAVSSTVPVRAMARILTETAVPLATTTPNNDSGWGRVDAFAALVALARPATLSGTVRSSGGAALAGVRIVAIGETVPPVAGLTVETTSSADGSYLLALSPGIYAVSAEAFGYLPEAVPRLEVVPGSHPVLDFALTARPAGVVQGRLSVVASGVPPTRTVVVRALGTPVSAVVHTSGYFSLSLPQGDYVVEAKGLGYRVVTETVSVRAGWVTTSHLRLEPIPTVLFVDEGAWYYGSQAPYWRAALDALRFAYDEVRIKVPRIDAPISATLALYDVVLWSSPQGSPGLIGAQEAVEAYLEQGGRLLLSGQDVAYMDAGGVFFGGTIAPYLYEQMSVQYVADRGLLPYVSGSGPFADLRLSLTGPDGADNQVAPDVVGVNDPSRASLVWRYDDGGGAGVATELCVPFRSLFFGFGLEALGDAADRADVLQRSIDWLVTAPLTAGLALEHATAPTLVGPPGATVTHVVTLRHIAYAGVTETVQLSIRGATWETRVLSEHVDLPPCTTVAVTVPVTIPADAGVNVTDVAVLEATLGALPEPVTLTLTTKTPAPVLLVVDDRWYPMQDYYAEALSAAAITFDIWETQVPERGIVTVNSPMTDTLDLYPVVVWFTGYDWYAPILPTEAAILSGYLNRGGRLMLSSQDFAYQHANDPFRDQLGILFGDWHDKVTQVQGVVEHAAGGTWGPVDLAYPFPNWSHTVEPSPDAEPILRGQLGQPIAVGMRHPDSGAPQSLFYGFALEALPLSERTRALATGIGWLSPLGSTGWLVTPPTVRAGETVTFALTVRNTAADSLRVEASHQIPPGFTLLHASLPPGVTEQGGRLHWGGIAAPGDPLTLTWSAVWVGGSYLGQPPTVTMSLPEWGLAFTREAPFYGSGADLGSSHWEKASGETLPVGKPLTLTFLLENRGLDSTGAGTVSLWLMRGTAPITASEPPTHGLALGGWSGTLGPGEQQTIALPIRTWNWDRLVRLNALLDDGMGHRWEERLWLVTEPWRQYFPVVRRAR